MDIEADSITLYGFLNMLDYLAEFPSEYYKLQNDQVTNRETAGL
jgi:hypothetical protein